MGSIRAAVAQMLEAARALEAVATAPVEVVTAWAAAAMARAAAAMAREAVVMARAAAAPAQEAAEMVWAAAASPSPREWAGTAAWTRSARLLCLQRHARAGQDMAGLIRTTCGSFKRQHCAMMHPSVLLGCQLTCTIAACM